LFFSHAIPLGVERLANGLFLNYEGTHISARRLAFVLIDAELVAPRNPLETLLQKTGGGIAGGFIGLAAPANWALMDDVNVFVFLLFNG
jgi:hypothetical protein